MSKKFITKKDLIKTILENNDNKELLLDKKKCPKCDTILLDNKDVCDECGYKLKESEEIFEVLKNLWNPKYVNEQISSPGMNGSVIVSKKDIADKNLVQSIRKSDPKATIRVADEVVDKSK